MRWIGVVDQERSTLVKVTGEETSRMDSLTEKVHTILIKTRKKQKEGGLMVSLSQNYDYLSSSIPSQALINS